MEWELDILVMTGGIEHLEYLMGSTSAFRAALAQSFHATMLSGKSFLSKGCIKLLEMLEKDGKSRSRKGDLKIPCAGSVNVAFANSVLLPAKYERQTEFIVPAAP